MKTGTKENHAAVLLEESERKNKRECLKKEQRTY